MAYNYIDYEGGRNKLGRGALSTLCLCTYVACMQKSNEY